jgi:inositol 3-alpha-galactosyltransferase
MQADSVLLDPSKGGEAPQFTNYTSNGSNGLGNGAQQGREPVNGVAGAGTASEPYDQGNSNGTYLTRCFWRNKANTTSDPKLGGAAPQHTESTTNGSSGKKYAYTTLITRGSYLAGVIILAHTLRKQGSRYPLVVYYTSGVSDSAVQALEMEKEPLNLILEKVDLLLPPAHVKTWLIAERFTDTWTKLRVFELFGYDAVCYLDADMAIFNRSMDCVFEHEADLPSDWIAANHACVCNKERDVWAPEDWREENCGFTPLEHPEALTKPTQVTPDSRPTYHLLNSGMFLYHPSEQLWDRMLEFFNTTDKLSTFKFPDQDFLAEFFRNKWRSIGWQFNALKTMRYWHPKMWRDDEVVCLHYIVDKPWAGRVKEDGTAGYKGNDGETHTWWWNAWEEYVSERKAEGKDEVLQLLKKYVASPRGEDGEQDPDMLAIGTGAQKFANNGKPDEKTGNGESESKDEGEPHVGGPPLRKKMLGERGHGPVVKPNGSAQMPL